MSRNKFSYLRGTELLSCRNMLDEIKPGPQKEFAEELYRRFEKICESKDRIDNQCVSFAALDEAIDGRL